ncbi:MAG: ankyrin repeat domain-containing protein [Gammaproteobacteria bacterium]|nr:ankyrin repeat domain-containing protein [Gammaproteobacteria bacterium]MDE0271199.1 ankyrin repeat domain-containing protein [Gammaproteobacteria bacterium]
MKGMLRNWKVRVRRWAGSGSRWLEDWVDPQVRFVATVAAIGFAVMWIVGRWYGAWDDFWKGVYIEGTGALLDLVVIGIIIGLIVGRRERKRQIQNQQELIDDFKKWDSEEARYRIAGAVRRMNRLGRTSIDFVGMEIRGFAFRHNDITSVAGTKFYAGSGGLGSRDRTVLEDVDFSFVNCSNVVFSPFNPFAGLWKGPPHHVQLRDCRFVEADLRGAVFKGALIEWTAAPPVEIGQWDKTNEGEPVWIPTHTPPFQMADLAGVSFEDVVFRNADFREAIHLEQCSFEGASGLEDCIFDSDEEKQWALRTAGAPRVREKDQRTVGKVRLRRRSVVAMLASIVVLGIVFWVVRGSSFVDWNTKPEARLVRWGDPQNCEGWSTTSTGPMDSDFFATATASAVRECLDAGADVDALLPNGETVLMRAAKESKDSETLAILMNAGADPNARTPEGASALLAAAFWRSDADEINVLLKGGADPNLRYVGLDGVTALHLAAERGNVKGVSTLLDYGAKPGILDDFGRTPLGAVVRTFKGWRNMWGPLGYHADAVLVARLLVEDGGNVEELHDHGWSKLHTTALLSTDRSALADLLVQRHELGAETPSGWTALHIAALANERVDVIGALLEAGADPHARFGNGRTPLHCAAFANRNPEVVETLVAGGADPTARTTIGWTPLHAAAMGNPNPEIVGALLEVGADVDSVLANDWNGEIHFPNERSLMDAPSLVTLDGGWEMINGRSTALHVASGHARNPSVIAALLDGGADPNSRDVMGETPLFNAMAGLFSNDIELAVVDQLLDAGADLNARNEGGGTALGSAVSFGLLEATTMLLDRGADPDTGTPLLSAATRPSVELTNLLLARGANPNARNTTFMYFHMAGDTPLHFVADSSGDTGVIDALLSGGADPNARNSQGRTALFSAVAPSIGDSNEAVVRRLLDAGADPNARDKAGRTPLIAVLQQNVLNLLVVEALLDGVLTRA